MPTLPTPEQIKTESPLSRKAADTVTSTRQALRDIFDRTDDRLIVIVGPCSIHHPEAALRYAEKLLEINHQHKENLCIIMRSYVEKSRTAIGWKGLISDPDLNNTFMIEKGLRQARALLLAINTLSIPVATEIVNPLVEPYLSDLISWAAIGARTTESQSHRELASHLTMPVGFKNNTHGGIQPAIDAVQTAKEPHSFIHPSQDASLMLTQSSGNPYSHLVLRGSHEKPNYDKETILKTNELLRKYNLIDQMIVDCSHGNSQKNHLKQIQVASELADRIALGDQTICGVMIESYLTAGKQIWDPQQTSRDDQSITDACLGWAETATILDKLSLAVATRRTRT